MIDFGSGLLVEVRTTTIASKRPNRPVPPVPKALKLLPRPPRVDPVVALRVVKRTDSEKKEGEEFTDLELLPEGHRTRVAVGEVNRHANLVMA